MAKLHPKYTDVVLKLANQLHATSCNEKVLENAGKTDNVRQFFNCGLLLGHGSLLRLKSSQRMENKIQK